MPLRHPGLKSRLHVSHSGERTREIYTDLCQEVGRGELLCWKIYNPSYNNGGKLLSEGIYELEMPGEHFIRRSKTTETINTIHEEEE